MPFAQKLSDLLKVKIRASTEFVWYGKKGMIGTGNQAPPLIPLLDPVFGEWKNFYPKTPKKP